MGSEVETDTSNKSYSASLSVINRVDRSRLPVTQWRVRWSPVEDYDYVNPENLPVEWLLAFEGIPPQPVEDEALPSWLNSEDRKGTRYISKDRS